MISLAHVEPDEAGVYLRSRNVSANCCIMSDMGSDRITVRIPEQLTARLRSRSRAQGTTESELVREALENYLGRSGTESSAFELAEVAGIIGIAQNGPTDLSTNPRHLKGFGKGK